jgi:hypothetical protein
LLLFFLGDVDESLNFKGKRIGGHLLRERRLEPRRRKQGSS